METERGAALIDDRDVEALSARFVDASGCRPDDDSLLEMIETIAGGGSATLWLPYGSSSAAVRSISSREVPERLGYIRDPRPDDCTIAAE